MNSTDVSGVPLGADGYCPDCEDVRHCGTIRKCLHGKPGTPGVPVVNKPLYEHPEDSPTFDAMERTAGVVAAPAHSKSEYKRRVAQGDPSVLPPSGGVRVPLNDQQERPL